MTSHPVTYGEAMAAISVIDRYFAQRHGQVACSNSTDDARLGSFYAANTRGYIHQCATLPLKEEK